MKIFRFSILELIIAIVVIIIIFILSIRLTVSNQKQTIQLDTVKIAFAYLPDQTIDYLKALRQAEANGRYKASNGSYLGGYQIGKLAKTDVGYAILHNEHSKELFLQDSVLQEEVMVRLLQSQIRIMYKYIQKYNNSNIGNYWITTSGILAMSHLCGPDATIKFLESRGKVVSKDGNNVNMTRYLQFNNFNLPIDSILQPNYINIHLMKYLKQ